jgi:hypothetical protein
MLVGKLDEFRILFACKSFLRQVDKMHDALWQEPQKSWTAVKTETCIGLSWT